MMRKKNRPLNKQNILIIAILGLSLLLIGLLSWLCLPFIQKLSNPAYQQEFMAWSNSLGIRGWLIVLGIQILQIIIAFIPGEPVELLAGVLYGAWGGLGTCLLGCVLASSLIFFTVRKFGQGLVTAFFGPEKVAQFSFFNNNKKVELVTFILFLIPGTPKDLLTYLAGLSKIKPSQFLVVSTFARIPSIITSTTMGASVSRGNWELTLVVFLITAAIGLLGIRYKDRIIAHFRRHHGG